MWRLLLIYLFLSYPLRAEGGSLLSRFWQSSDGLPGNVVLALGQTGDGFLWVATTEGLVRFDGREFERVILPEDFVSKRVRFDRIFTPSEGDVWLSTTQGTIYRVENDRLLPVEDNHAHLITGFSENEAWPRPLDTAFQSIWDSTDSPSLRADPQNNKRWFLTLPGNENAIPINDWLTDREGNLWLASTGHGLVRLKASRFTYLDQVAGLSLPSNRAALQTKEGVWWLANFNGGMDRIKAGVLTHHFPPETSSQNPFIGIHEDSRGVVRFVNEGGRVFVWNGQLEQLVTSDIPDPSSVQFLSEDNAGNLIAGTPKGVLRISNGVVTNLSSEFGLRNLRISFITLHKDEGLLLGTRDGRVILLTDTQAVDLGEQGTFSQNWISGIAQDARGDLWVSTLGSGLFRFHKGKWQHFSSEGNGLPDNRITAIHLGQNDEIWCGSLSGILRIDRRGLVDARRNSYWQVFDQEDGMRTRECIGTCSPSFFKGIQGALWFPTASGLAGIDPTSPTIRPTPAPPVYLRRIILNGKACPPDATKYKTGPGASRLEFHFFGINLKSPEKVRYSVRLRGYAEESRMVTTPSQATYEAVPPGVYSFEVTAINGDGIPSSSPLFVPIVIAPNFWETTLFLVGAILCSLLLAVLIGGLFVRRRAKRKIASLKLSNALELERSRIARDLHDDLGANLTELSIIASLAAEGNGHSSPQVAFSKMADKARKVVIALDEIVWAVSPQEDTLPSLIEYLDAYGAEFIGNAGLSYRSDLPSSIPPSPIGPRRRHHLCMATREALNNAVKHAAATEITLDIVLSDEHLTLHIRDNGRGFDPNLGNQGDGLANFRDRMEKCGGECSFSSNDSGGTIVTLSIPLRQPIETT